MSKVIIYPNREKLLKLSKAFSLIGLKKESSAILVLLKLARTDEDLGARSDYHSLPAAERRRILSNMSVYKTLSPEKRSEIAHSILDTIGLVPGVGDVADLTNAIWYAGEGNYSMAALSCVFLTPGLGTPAAALAKTTKVLPAKVIYEYADVFEDLITKLAPEIPNGPLVKQAVDQIIEGARKGYDLSLETGKSIMKETSQQVGGAVAKVMDPENAWYLNPKWQEWFLKIIEPALTKVLNSITERSFKTRLMKMLVDGRGIGIENLKFIKDPQEAELFKKHILEGNTELAKKVSASITKLIGEVKTVKINLATSRSAIPVGKESTFGTINIETNTITLFLPNYTRYLNNPSFLIESIQTTISHELWHAIDSKMQKSIFDRETAGKLMSELYATEKYIDSIKSKIDFSLFDTMTAERKAYLSYNPEIYVRIKSLKSFTEKTFKEGFNEGTLSWMIRNIDNPEVASFYKRFPSDAKELLFLLEAAPSNKLGEIVSLINKVP